MISRFLLKCSYSKLIIIFGLFGLNSNGRAYDKYEVDSTLEQAKDQCLLELLSDQRMKQSLGNLHLNYLNNQQKSQLLYLNDYCGCIVHKNIKNLELKNKNKMAYHFRDKTVELSNNDQCSLKHLPEELNKLVFSINLIKIRSNLQDSLDERSPASLGAIVNQDSLQQNLYCVQNIILYQCSRIASLHSTFRCIQEATSDSDELKKYKELCPKLVTADEDAPMELSEVPHL